MIKLSDESHLGNLVENQFGDHYLFSVNRKSFEKMGYQTFFNKEFENHFDQEDTLYVILGTDSGLMVKEMLKRPPKNGSAYLFIEFPEIIERTKTQYNLDDEKRIIVTTEDDWQEECKKIGMETYFLINKVKTIKSFAAQYYYLSEYVFLSKSIDDSINHITWQIRTQLEGKSFVYRQLENLADNHSPAIVLQDYFKGKSALILAGGPSLDKYIDWIEANQDKYVVIAVTRIARRLLETKIKPDIFVSVDPHPANFGVSKEVLKFSQESLLVTQYHVSPILLGNWSGANLYLGQLFPWDTDLNKNNMSGIGPTVTNSAILLAIKMGIKQQIFFGIDLCFSPEGYSHASGSFEHELGPDVNIIGQTVETNNGQVTETNSAYFEAISGIEQLAVLSKQLGGVFINPSPDSAKMNNVDYVQIQDLNTPEEEVSIKKFLEEKLAQSHQKEHKLNHYNKVLKELSNAKYRISKVMNMAVKGLDYNEKFFSGEDPSKNFKFKMSMDKVEKELHQKDLKDITELSIKFGAKEFLHFMAPDEDREWTNDEIKKSGDSYYKALKFGASDLYEKVQSAINLVEIRMLEVNAIKVTDEVIKRHFHVLKNATKLDQDVKDISKALEKCYFNDDSSLGNTKEERIHLMTFFIQIQENIMNIQPGRYLFLEQNKPDFYMIPDLTPILNLTVGQYKQECIRRYNSFFNPNENEQKKKKELATRRIALKLAGLEIKLYNLFTLNDKDSIKKIIKGIDLVNNKEPVWEAFLHLAQGYLFELENNIDNAITEYGQADDSKTIESALKRIAILSLEKGEFNHAHDTLQILSEISPDYLPQLAELFVVTKNYKDALNIYASYLDYYPSDISILLKVAQLYEAQDVLDGVKFIYDQILALDPENEIARKYMATIH